MSLVAMGETARVVAERATLSADLRATVAAYAKTAVAAGPGHVTSPL